MHQCSLGHACPRVLVSAAGTISTLEFTKGVATLGITLRPVSGLAGARCQMFASLWVSCRKKLMSGAMAG